MNILLVCTGNTCRSSMAEGIFRNVVEAINGDIKISSAGIAAFEGDRANDKAIKVLKKKGIDISGHKARQLTINMIEDADLILTMTYAHKRTIIDYIEESSDAFHMDKVFTLKEYAYLVSGEEVEQNNLDINDPFGMDYDVYEETMMEIEFEIEKIVNNIDKFK